MLRPARPTPANPRLAPPPLRAGHGLILIVAALLSVGVLMVSSAGLGIGRDRPLTFIGILTSRHAMFAALAFVLMLVATRVPLDRVSRWRGVCAPAPWIAAASIVLLLAVHLPGVGHEVNGARRWILLGPIGFQPSELVKWGVLVVLASYAARHAGGMGRIGVGFLVPMTLVGILCALIALEDLGTAVLIGLVSVAVLVAAGARVWHALALLPLGALSFAAAVVSNPYRVDRLRAFLDPFDDPRGIGYHVIQSMAAVAGGGLVGRGLGGGVQKFGYLPEDTTDFLFAIIAEELGFAGAAFVVFLYAALLLCGFSIVQRAATPFSRLLGLGILLTVGFQTVINLLVVTGLAPTKGIALPLLSAGGTGWCLTAFCLGLLVAMDRTRTETPRLGHQPAARRRDTPPPAVGPAAVS
ncbi:MAG: cell division protein FtsW [Phycisphaerales bacterium]|nr:putative lipid II flippase FtsW [Phycisphaerae bacterium]NNM26879.1 cell division protein FtsW [Phycisphaerales bacterium]